MASEEIIMNLVNVLGIVEDKLLGNAEGRPALAFLQTQPKDPISLLSHSMI